MKPAPNQGGQRSQVCGWQYQAEAGVPDILLLSKHRWQVSPLMGSHCKKPAYLHLGRIPLVLCASTFLICKVGVSANGRRLVTGFPGALVVKYRIASAGDSTDSGSIPRSGRFPGGGHSRPLQPPEPGGLQPTVSQSPTRPSTQTDGHKIGSHKWHLTQGAKQKGDKKRLTGGGVPSLSRVQPFATSWTPARQAPLSLPISRSLLKFMSNEAATPSNHLTLYHPLLLPLTGIININKIATHYYGTPLQYSCLENPMGGGAWWAAVHGVAEGRTRLSDFTFTSHFHALEKEMATTPVFLPGESQGRGAWWAAVSGDLPAAAAATHYYCYYYYSSVQASRSLVSDSLRPHELQHARPPHYYIYAPPKASHFTWSKTQM